MEFDAPLVLLMAPVVGGAVWFAAAWARRARVSRAARWSPEAAAVARKAGPFGPTALSIAAFLGTVALAGPRWGEERIEAETRGLSLVMVVDISRSMLAEDAGGGSRLARALREARRLTHDLDGDHLGLVAFAGASYILSPLSTDGSALGLYLDAMDPDMASEGGTSLAPALRTGGELLNAGSALADRVLVVFTDGEGHDSLVPALRTAEELGQAGVHVVLVGEGGQAAVHIPLRDDQGRLQGWQRDEDGNVIETWRRDTVLNAVADAAQGTVVAADLPDQAGAIRDLVAAYKRSRSSEARVQRGRPQAWVPLLFGMLVLFGQAVSRRTAALVVWLLVAGLSGRAARAQQLEAPAYRRSVAEKAWDRGDTAAARRAYLAELLQRRSDDAAWFNAGAAALAAGDRETAQSALGRAAASLDPEIRFRALYDQGWLALREASADSVNREAHLSDAERAYREALLLQPHNLAAKWNLELAVRRKSGGGGGGPSKPPPSNGGGGNPQEQDEKQPPPPPSGGLTRSQAEEVLRSIGQEELKTRRQQVGRTRRGAPPGIKDW